MAVSGFSLQGGGQGNTSFLQPQNTAQNKQIQAPSSSVQLLQPTVNGVSLQGGSANGIALNQSGTGKPLGPQTINAKNTAAVQPDTTVQTDPAAAAAAAKAAADAAKAGQLRGEVTNLVNSIKDILNQRYGQIDSAAQEQIGKLTERFNNESGDLTNQITNETNSASGGFAARGTRDSSDYGNTVDSITQAGQAQIRDLGTGLKDDTATVGGYVQSEKAKLDASKGGYDATVAHLAEETDPGRLTDLRNTIDAKLRETQSGSADNATQKSSISALESIAPSTARAQSLQATLAKIVGGNAPAAQKSAIAQQLIKASGVSDADAQKLAQAFTSDLGTTDKQQVTQ